MPTEALRSDGKRPAVPQPNVGRHLGTCHLNASMGIQPELGAREMHDRKSNARNRRRDLTVHIRHKDGGLRVMAQVANRRQRHTTKSELAREGGEDALATNDWRSL